MVDFEKVKPYLDQLEVIQCALSDLGVTVAVSIDYSNVQEMSDDELEEHCDRISEELTLELDDETMN